MPISRYLPLYYSVRLARPIVAYRILYIRVIKRNSFYALESPAGIGKLSTLRVEVGHTTLYKLKRVGRRFKIVVL